MPNHFLGTASDQIQTALIDPSDGAAFKNCQANHGILVNGFLLLQQIIALFQQQLILRMQCVPVLAIPLPGAQAQNTAKAQQKGQNPGS
ncbi:MAG: hypothetical protein EBT14_08475 [Betaproteobacteria bacterium]|nr:hypothetical protein [Betaproteobacteria bacterium]